MSELITQEIFTDGQQNINAANMNGIIGKATVQPDVIINKPASVTMDVADQFLVLKTDNTLAKSRFDTIVNSTSSTLPVADSTKNGMLRQVSGNTTDFVDGSNHCQPLTAIVPVGTVWDTLASAAPVGWLLCDGHSYLQTDYPALFALIGTLYGSVDSTHFNVPDCRGRVTVGVGTGTGLTARVLGATGGEEKHQLTVGELATHNHGVTDPTHNHVLDVSIISTGGGSGYAPQPPNTGSGQYQTRNSATGITIQNNGSSTPHNTMPPFLVVNKMVKT